MKYEVIFMIGISGSGKSTWAINHIKENANWLRINRDDIRKTLIGTLEKYYDREDLHSIETTVNALEESFFLKITNHAEYNCIIDATHLKQRYINRWLKHINEIDACTGHEAIIKFKIIDRELLDAKYNVAMRDFGGKPTITDSCLSYIDRQFEDFRQIKEWVKSQYGSQVI